MAPEPAMRLLGRRLRVGSCSLRTVNQMPGRRPIQVPAAATSHRKGRSPVIFGLAVEMKQPGCRQMEMLHAFPPLTLTAEAGRLPLRTPPALQKPLFAMPSQPVSMWFVPPTYRDRLFEGSSRADRHMPEQHKHSVAWD